MDERDSLTVENTNYGYVEFKFKLFKTRDTYRKLQDIQDATGYNFNQVMETILYHLNPKEFILYAKELQRKMDLELMHINKRKK